jgi:hypothetical protein
MLQNNGFRDDRKSKRGDSADRISREVMPNMNLVPLPGSIVQSLVIFVEMLDSVVSIRGGKRGCWWHRGTNI